MDIFRKAMLAGLGAFSLTRDKAQELLTELVKAGEIQEQESKEMLEEMMKKAKAMRAELEKNVGTQVRSAAAKLNSATLVQVRRLEARLRQIEKSLAARRAGKKPAAGRARRATRRGSKRRTSR